MAIGTLFSILQKIRKYIGLPRPEQISDSDLEDYVDSYYLYDLPASFRNLKLRDTLTFNTSKGISTYPFDFEHYTSIEPPAKCEKREIGLYQEPNAMYGALNLWQQEENFATGNGTQGPYTATLSATPIIRSVNTNPTFSVNPNYPAGRIQNILITTSNGLNQTQNVIDDGNGNLIQILPNGTVVNSGTIDYASGAISVSFQNTVDQGATIQIQYWPTVLGRPLGMLYFAQQFTLLPVPDKGYTIEIGAYRQPSQALSETPNQLGTPELIEWWELIAAGAAMKFFEDSGDDNGKARMKGIVKEKLSLANTRSYAQLGTQQVDSIYKSSISNSNSGIYNLPGGPAP